ncbi:MAG: hypothetical protein KAJ16_02810 [Calditrichia bacterium]|nr:hypothetical protein [Calditrichia bacterium]MCK5453262.1 hypothetical protein [Calditrichia bacterium]
MIVTMIEAGIIATAGMTALLWLFDKTGKINANMVRAIGSAVTRSAETSLWPGLIIQFVSGILFAFIYMTALNMLQLQGILSLVIAGGVIGFAHGFAFSFVMVILAEHHPVEKFQNAGFQVAIVHFLAHIVYGLLVGLVFGLSL